MKIDKYPSGLEALLRKAGNTGSAGVYVDEDPGVVLKARRQAERYIQAVVREGKATTGVLHNYAIKAKVTQKGGYVYIDVPIVRTEESVWDRVYQDALAEASISVDPEWERLKNEES